MIARLAAVTALIALFAVSFASLVQSTRPSFADMERASDNCLETGLVCAIGS